MALKAVLFDLDGTLVNTLDDLADAANQVLAGHGFPTHPTERFKIFVGDGLRQLMTRITPASITPAELEQCCQDFVSVYHQCWDRNSRPYPGVEAMLSSLSDHGLRLAVLSNKPHAFTTVYMERFFAGHHFDMVLGQREGVPRKPDPAGALEIAAKLRIAAGQCAYVGDSGVDMLTGKAAGMLTIGVSWGFRTVTELLQHNADLIVATPEEIVLHVTAAP